MKIAHLRRWYHNVLLVKLSSLIVFMVIHTLLIWSILYFDRDISSLLLSITNQSANNIGQWKRHRADIVCSFVSNWTYACALWRRERFHIKVDIPLSMIVLWMLCASVVVEKTLRWLGSFKTVSREIIVKENIIREQRTHRKCQKLTQKLICRSVSG